MTALAMKANLHNDNGDWQIKGGQESQINQKVAGDFTAYYGHDLSFTQIYVDIRITLT